MGGELVSMREAKYSLISELFVLKLTYYESVDIDIGNTHLHYEEDDSVDNETETNKEEPSSHWYKGSSYHKDHAKHSNDLAEKKSKKGL